MVWVEGSVKCSGVSIEIGSVTGRSDQTLHGSGGGGWRGWGGEGWGGGWGVVHEGEYQMASMRCILEKGM